ncbi:Polyketide synthase PksL [compost metagenome]
MELEREIYEKYNINPESISYAEMHGTGTKQGDPIELEALSTVFKEKTAKQNFCAIGSVKSNIGHTSAASGIASIQKVLLCMQKETLVPTLNFHQPNDHFDFANSPFYVNTQVKPWTSSGSLPLRACVSSFGFSGTNAHVVVEAYVPGPARPSASSASGEAGKPLLMVLSAKKKEQLNTQVGEIGDFLLAEPDLELADAAYTLQIGREPMDYRLAVVADSREKLLGLLDAYLSGRPAEGVFSAYVKESRKEIRIFETDEDAKALSEAWIKAKKLNKIAELWVKGWNLDWNRLYGEIKPRRISLPAYSFAKERYWLPKLALQTDQVPPIAASSVEANLPATVAAKRVPRLLRKHWRPSSSTQVRKNVQSVVILANSETANLADQLSRYFPQYEIVSADRTGIATSGFEWHNYDGLVDLIGCGTDADDSMDWISWLQKLVEHGNKEGLTLLGVTKGLESLQNDRVNLAGATRAGLYRMLQSEYSYLHSRHVDTDAYAEDDELARLIAEELILVSEEPEVCYRNGQRYTSLLEEEHFSDENGEFAIEVETFPEDRVLLITGGTRGLGLLCAQHFVRKYQVKKLVLTGREALPPRDEWVRLNQMNDSTRRKIRAIQELEGLGIQVHVLSLRLSDVAAAMQSLQDIGRNLGPIGGVIHCAGMADWRNPAFIRKNADDIRKVLEPKVEGLQTLYRLLPKEPLQFFVLFSSVSSIVPSLAVGQSDYAMSNAYMDYFAEAYQQEVPIVSIQWPNWKESGMGEAKSKSYAETGLLGMTDAEGLQWLDRILAQKLRSVVLPAVVDIEHWKPDLLMRRDVRKMAPSEAGNIRAKSPEDASPKTTGDIYEKTQAWLIELFAKELKILPDHLAADEPFQEYGVDSIILTQLLQQINGEIEANLDPSIIYEYPTIQSFAAWLAKEFAGALTKVLGNLPAGAVDKGTSEQHSAGPLVDRAQSELSDELNNRSSVRGTQANDIAVVGLSCRFPGAENLDAFWELLSAGRSAIRQVPEERWHHEGTCYAGLLNDIHHFDPSFFQLSEEDAKAMDPQSLVVLEQCLNLWYHAGYAHEEVKGKAIGVYLGGRSQHRPTEESLQHVRNPIAAMGQNYMAANVSQFFDLRGPSVVIDTACSSALVGMNMAIQALYSGEIEAAVVGGVSLLDTEDAYRMFGQRGILSKGSSFHIFDERGSGIVLGEGVGIVLLKTLDQARRDGDSIYAVVKAAAVNNDGRTVGPAAPNPQAQKDVMRAALDRSGKRPEDISYIEANGSGSAVTDLLELKAIQSVYRAEGPAPIGVGSVKPNIGHPLCAEGIAGFIKVVLMLQHRSQVPFLSGEKAMPHFDPESAGIHFNREAEEWRESQPVAAINCFADGGTNAHVILESWTEQAGYLTRRRPLPAPELKKRSLSAKDTVMTVAGKSAGEPQIAHGTRGIFWKTFA